MARKTNKTDHVLNLLSSGNPKEGTDEKKESVSQPPVEPGEVASVSIVQPSPEKEQLADDIKNSLEEELAAAVSSAAEELEEIEPPADKEAPVLTAETEVEEAPALKEPPEVEMTSGTPEAVGISEGVETETVTPAVTAPEAVEPAAVTKPEAVEPAAVTAAAASAVPTVGAGEPDEEERDFEFINVMELLVKDQALGYMKQFGMCTCPRCLADTIALALTQLPPKYVVVKKEAVSPLVNFYTKKFAGQVTVEITKACIQVGDVPHHSRT